MRYFRKNNKYKDRQKDSGMTVTVRQIKNKDGTTTSDINGVIRVLKKKLMKEGLFKNFVKEVFFNQEVKKTEEQKVAGKVDGNVRWKKESRS